MRPAARVGDMTACPLTDGPKPHGGGPIIPPCAITVLTGNRPQARVTDIAQCVGPPSMIVTGAWTVLVEGRPAARVGDMTNHGGVIITGDPTVLIGGAISLSGLLQAGLPSFWNMILEAVRNLVAAIVAAAGPQDSLKDRLKDAIESFVDTNIDTGTKLDGVGEALIFDLNLDLEWGPDGPRLDVKFDMSFARFETGSHAFGKYVSGWLDGEVLSVSAQRSGDLFGDEASFLGDGKGFVKGSVWTLQPGVAVGDDEANPWVRADVKGAFASGEVMGDKLSGDDGHRQGVAAGGKAGADLAAGEVALEVNVPSPFGEDRTIQGRGALGGGLVSAGGGLGGHGYEDTDSGRTHVGAGGEVKAGAGVQGNIDFSEGPKFKDRKRSSPSY